MDWFNTRKTGKYRAVAYYRHSAQDRQENSVEIQQDQVRQFAKEHDIEIIREFADKGKSGLSTEGRDGFNEMLRDYVRAERKPSILCWCSMSAVGVAIRIPTFPPISPACAQSMVSRSYSPPLALERKMIYCTASI